MATHNLSPDEVQAIVREYLQPQVVPEALEALEAQGYYMTGLLPRPTSEFLAGILRKVTRKRIGHIATPPQDPIDVYWLLGDKRVNLEDIQQLAAELSAQATTGRK